MQSQIVTLNDSLTSANAQIVRLMAERDGLLHQVHQHHKHIQQSSAAIVAGYEQREQDSNVRLTRLERQLREQRRLLQLALAGLESAKQGGCSVDEPLAALLEHLDQQPVAIAHPLGEGTADQLLAALPHELPSTAQQRANLWIRLSLAYATAVAQPGAQPKSLVAAQLSTRREQPSPADLWEQLTAATAGAIAAEHELTLKEPVYD